MQRKYLLYRRFPCTNKYQRWISDFVVLILGRYKSSNLQAVFGPRCLVATESDICRRFSGLLKIQLPKLCSRQEIISCKQICWKFSNFFLEASHRFWKADFCTWNRWFSKENDNFPPRRRVAPEAAFTYDGFRWFCSLGRRCASVQTQCCHKN